MLANTITLNDGTSDHVYDLVSRQGMESLRRETGVSSSLNSGLTVKNTVDLGNASAQNRHLVQIARKEIDATTGAEYKGSVHCVISRDKNFTDAELALMIAQLCAFLGVSANITDILLGGN